MIRMIEETIIMAMIVTFQTFGVEVLGLDLSDNMVDIAMERAITENLPSVRVNVPMSYWFKHHR